jgi:hypothetical protein
VALLRGANLALAFVLELAALLAVGSWAFGIDAGTAVQLLGAVVAITGFVVLWGVFAAPKARYRLAGGPRAVFEVVWFGTAAVLAAIGGHTTFAFALALLALVNRVLLRTWHQQDSEVPLD